MKISIFTLGLLFAGCIPYQLPPEEGGRNPIFRGQITFALRLNQIQAVDIPALEWGESELYLAMGSLTSMGDSSHQVFPANGDIILRESLDSDRGFSIFQGTLNRSQAVAINLSLLETDCQKTDREQVARALVPRAARFREGDTSGNVMAQGVPQDYLNALIRAARLAFSGFDVVLDQYCMINKDDIMGAFLFHAQNENGRIRWNVECIETCEVMSTQGRNFAIRFNNGGIHVVMFELASVG